RIAVLNGGEIQQIAAPLDLYRHPANRFVAEFIGSPPMNFMEMEVKDATQLAHPGFTLTLPDAWGTTLASYRGQTVVLGVRPEHFDTIPDPDGEGLSVQVALVEALGHETYLACTFEDRTRQTAHLQVRTDPQQLAKRGDRLKLSINAQHIHLFETASGAAILPQA
ncbi:MAG: TOBE domain-containing protein, partial [Thermosynechococcaceae cyanobacterium]